MTVGRLPKRTADRWPERVALVDDSIRVTYQELADCVARFATGLQSRNIETGDAVGVVAANSLEQVVSLLAAQALGAIAVPVNPRLSADELSTILSDAEATAVICDADRADVVRQASNDLPKVSLHVAAGSIDDMEEFESVAADGTSDYPSTSVASNDPALMMHTSGSTGRPKLVVIDHQSQLLNSLACNAEFDTSPEDTALHIAPLSHSAGYLNLLLPCLHRGATNVLHSSFDPKHVLKCVEQEAITISLGVPTHFQQLQNVDSSLYDLSSLRMLVTSGASISQTVADWVRESLCATFINVYGLTEATGLITIERDIQTTDIGFSIGESFLDVDVRLVEVGDDVSPRQTVDEGKRGQLISRSPKVMKEYFDRPDATHETLREGWLYTGDIAVEDDGTYYLVDRMDNVIISGGENIYPQEVESVLEDHPDVVDCAVVGEPDDTFGEVVSSYVVSQKPALDIKDIESFWKEQSDMADFKRPRRLTLVQEIPRNASGNIRRALLGDGPDA